MTFRSDLSQEEYRKFDPYAHAVTIIEEQHRLGHDGFMFHVSHKVASISNGANFDVLLAVPAAVRPHVQRLRVDLGAGNVDILLYEAPTTSAAGTGLSAVNTNRNSANTANMVVTHTPTVTGTGTLLHTDWVPPTGAGVGSSNGAREVSAGEEWLLAPSTDYLFRITNNSGGSIAARVEILFYELDYED